MAVKTKANFYRLASCFYYCNKFFGLAAFSYNPTKRKFSESVGSVAYCLLFLVFTFFFYPYLMYQFLLFLEKSFSTNLGTSIGTFQSLLQWLTLISIQCINIYDRKDIVVYYNKKVLYDKKFSSTIPEIYRKKYFLSMLFLALIVFVFKLLSGYILMAFIVQKEQNIKPFLIIYLIPSAITTLTGCSFTMEITCLQFFVTQINCSLKKLAVELVNFPKTSSEAQKMILSCGISDKIDLFLIFHSDLTKFIATFNRLQTRILLFYFTNKFLELIIPAFFKYLTIAGLTATTSTADIFANSLFNDVFNIMELIMMTVCTNSLMNEMSTTAKILHEFPVHKTDDRLKESINRFSLQILQEKRPISVCGMFNVDNTLLYSMISSMTSYLILLVQFQLQGVGSSKG
ncbi:putative gustatory receptor 28b [Phlebotomus papatasi]|uniref:putative gustatory receptor 28b n=1 Tax=Phlebotomus papatasi TaxID=29031 RepID=UPI002483461B|nr:putative gustatory receptor 28b [Phlebotomus papatasi]